MKIHPPSLLLALGLLSAASLVGCHAAAGPTFGYTIDRGPSLGWEVSGGYALFRGSVGGIYRDKEPDHVGDQIMSGSHAPYVESVHYIALEPWYYAGATLGVSSTSDGEINPMLGVWEGFPFSNINGPCLSIFSGSSSVVDQVFFGSISGGYRYVGGEHEIYIAPKVGVLQCD